MKNILIPTDFSLNSSNAILYGLELFGNYDTKFYFLHVDHPIIDMPTSSIEFMAPTNYPDLVSQKKMVKKQITDIID